ncbi:MAG TPA: DUF6603 domain-containing protein, partial [Streptosporangiaceae bacterium]|nr:DUF6603 domain-containing protein [Streptosporangiaceae bacterium]
MGVEVTFTSLTGSVQVVVQATGDSTWTFTAAFPVLHYTIFDTLRFQAPILTLDSTATLMTFTGTLIITTPMAPLDLLMPGVTHSVTGEITMVGGPAELGFTTSTVPDILLYGPEGATLNLGLFTVTDLRYEILSDPLFDYDAIDWTAVGSISVTGAVPITVAGVRHDVLVGTQITGWGNSLLFSGDFTDLGSITLADVTGFSGQSALPIPFDLNITSPVILTDVRMLVTPATAMINYISLKLQTQEEWTIAADLLVMQAADVTFRIDSPLSAPRLSGVLSGLFGIGANGTLELSADFGAGTVGGALRAADGPLSIGEVYTWFTNVDPAPVPDLSITNFDFSVTLPTNSQALAYNAFLELAGSWQLTSHITLDDVMFAMQHDQDTAFQSLAVFSIEGVSVKITAAYDPAPDKQWQFTGSTGPGQQIAIGGLFQTLADAFGAITLPTPIAQLVIENLGAEISTGNNRLYLTGEALFPIDTTRVDITLAIDTAQRSFTARIVVTVPTDHGPFTPQFDLLFAGNLFVAAYSHAAGDPVPQLKDLVTALLPSAAAFVPAGLVVDLKDAFIAVDGATKVFGADLKVTIDLSHLPVFGDHLDLGVMGFDPLRMIAISAALAAAEVTAIDALLPSAITKLPEEDLAAGFLFDGLLKLGALEKPLVLPVSETQPPAPTTSKDTQTADNTLWYKVQRSFGPLQIDRVGVAYLHEPGKSAQLAVLVDASLSLAGLTLTLTGLQAGLALSDPAAGPTFDLAGLGLAYVSGPVEISGSFLKSSIVYNGTTYPAYGGQAVIRTSELSIGAIGSYMELPEGPSLFVYAFLDYPIGGPAFFFVRGLAAGFGYNRRFVPPALDKLADFPLVADAIGGSPPSTSLAGQLQRLDPSLPPSPGDYFLMAGIHFTSFEMIDSFLLLAVSFGHRFELNLLGLSTLVLPAADASAAGVTPIAEVQLALRASFVPDDGVFSISAQLTPNSFLLSRDCHLTGGFAFSSWFDGPHNGDFVLSVGGYHPHFVVPAHYPAVPRLGFVWQVSPQLQLTGSAYYALTPSALMAGGSLSATWQDGSLRAWFDTSMDFLIAWQPYHYEASVHISVGASYTFSFFGTHTVTAHVGADVNFWGPDFGGRAYIDLSVVSFTITFGASGSARPQPIPWSTFKATLLPPAAQITTIALGGGSVAPGTGADLGVVDPHGLMLVTDSVIPSSGAVRGPAAADAALPVGTTRTMFGVSPLGLASAGATHRIEITSGGRAVDQLFTYTPVGKQLPYALWGGALETSLSHPQLVGELLTGYTVRPLPPVEPATSPTLPAAALQSLTPLFTEQGAFQWAPLEQQVVAGGDAATIDLGLTDPGVAAIRAALTDALLKGAPIDLGGFTAGQFLEIPQVAAHA